MTRAIRGTLATFVALLAIPAAASAARNLYVSNGTAEDSVSIFGFAATGEATPLPAGTPNPFPEPGTNPAAAAMSPSGAHLYVVNSGSSSVVPHTVAANGALGDLATAATGAGAAGITVTADGRFVYVANNGDDTISAYSVDADGTLTELPGSPFGAGAQPFGVASSPDSGTLYVTNSNGASVSAFEIAADGALTELGTSPYPTGLQPRGVSIAPDGDFLYVADSGDDDVTGFAVAADGGLTELAGSPFTTAAVPLATAISPDGGELLLGAGSGVAVSHPIEADGALGAAQTAPAAATADSVAVHPAGTSAYVVADATDQLFSYSLSASGALAAVGAGQALPAGAHGFQAAVITPNQPPVAGFFQGTTPASVVATFDGSTSADPDGQVVSYRWNFGDGKTETTSIPTVSHKYATNGTYDVTLRVIDNEGCSATPVYTGQTMLCNGSGVATITKTIDTAAPPRPDDRVKNPTLAMKRNQRLGKRSVRVEVKVGAGESARIKLSGFIRRSKHRIKLRKQTVHVKGANRKQVVMKVRSKGAQKRVHKLLRKAGALQATVHADFKDDAGNRAELRQSATLLPRKRR